MGLGPAEIHAGLSMHHYRFPSMHICCFSGSFPQRDGRRTDSEADTETLHESRENTESSCCYIPCEPRCHFASFFHLVPSLFIGCVRHTPALEKEQRQGRRRGANGLDDLCVFGTANRRKGRSFIGIDWGIILCIVARLLH